MKIRNIVSMICLLSVTPSFAEKLTTPFVFASILDYNEEGSLFQIRMNDGPPDIRAGSPIFIWDEDNRTQQKCVVKKVDEYGDLVGGSRHFAENIGWGEGYTIGAECESLPKPTFTQYGNPQRLLISKNEIPEQSWSFRTAEPNEIALIQSALLSGRPKLSVTDAQIVESPAKKQMALVQEAYNAESEDGTSTSYIVLGRVSNGQWTEASTFSLSTFEGSHNLYLDLNGDGIPEFIEKGYGSRGTTIHYLLGDL